MKPAARIAAVVIGIGLAGFVGWLVYMFTRRSAKP